MAGRGDGRTRESARALDAAARYRRQKKALEALEQDNFQEEPHADLGKNFRILVPTPKNDTDCFLMPRFHTQ